VTGPDAGSLADRVAALADDIDATRLATCRACKDPEFAQYNPHRCEQTRKWFSAQLRTLLPETEPAPSPVECESCHDGRDLARGWECSGCGRVGDVERDADAPSPAQPPTPQGGDVLAPSRYAPGHFDGDGCIFPEPGHFATSSSQPPAPQGGDVEALARQVETSCTHENRTGRDWCCSHCHSIAYAIRGLAAHDAEVERAVAERIAVAWDEGYTVGYREHADDTLAGHGISVGPVTPNPYRARAEGA
jgi:hypothetical protein